MFWVVGYGSNSFITLNQLVSLGYKGLIMTDYSYAWTGFYKMNPELAQHILTVSHVETENFRKNFKPKGGSIIGMHLYDSALVMADAYIKCNGDTEKMAEYINNIKDYEGAQGVWTMRPTGDIYIPTDVVRWKDGDLVPVDSESEEK